MRSILITGGASGIGAGLGRELGSAGHHVILGDLERHDGRPVAAEIRAGGGSAEAVVMDVTSDDSVGAALRAVSRPPEVLVNNAGLQNVAPLEEFPIAKWDYLIQVMLTGTARVINMGSIHSLVASPFKSAYVAAKHGLLGFARTLALETADIDITVNTICPSYVRTPLVDAQIADQARARGIPEAEVISRVMLEPMPKGVFIGYDELAATVAFLVSHTARNITGQMIVIDGGWTAR